MAVDYTKDGRIATFTINRPDVLNALNSQVWQELHDAMVDFQDDPELWVGILTGTGERAFSAGADITEMRPASQDQGPQRQRPSLPRGLEIWKPLIAAINGYCLGGGMELALACDIRIAAEHARLGQPEVLRGLMAGAGGSQRLTRFIPWCKAAELLLTGKHIDAQEAYRIGLINAVVPLQKLMSTAKEWAEAICQAAPLAVRATKEAMTRGYDMPLQEGLRLENLLFGYLRTTADFAEGTRAFVEQRKPNYKGQ